MRVTSAAVAVVGVNRRTHNQTVPDKTTSETPAPLAVQKPVRGSRRVFSRIVSRNFTNSVNLQEGGEAS